MIDYASGDTEVLSTNFWFGSPLSDTFTAGTAALEKLYSSSMPVTRFRVDCNVPNNVEHQVNHFRYYLDAFRRARDHLAHRKPNHVVNLGGGCAAAIAILPYLHSVHPDLRVIWIDAHFDLHLPSTSRSHYIHGMTVGILTDPEWYGRFFNDRWSFDPRRILFCAQKTSDSYEREMVAQQSRRSISIDAGFKSAATVNVSDLKGHPVYIHLDLDSLRPGVYPNPKCDIAGGLEFADLSTIVSTIRNTTEVIGYAIAENPETDETKLREVVNIFLKLPWSERNQIS